MSGELMQSVMVRAMRLGVPITAHLDLTYRCNERCVHCYLDHESPGELTTSEVIAVLDQLADAGTLFLTFSGGETFLRPDLFELIAHARRLMFAIKLKTNAITVTEERARAIAAHAVQEVQVSLYSHRPKVHDGITRVPGSFVKTRDGIQRLRDAGVRVTVANVLMRHNQDDVIAVQELARELGATYTLDPTVTPNLNGTLDVLNNRVERSVLLKVFADPRLTGVDADRCEPERGINNDVPTPASDVVPCSAGHTLVYIDPCGKLFPCVQFPLLCGDLRKQSFAEIWAKSPQLLDARAVQMNQLPICFTCCLQTECTRCPGLAYMEGDMRGASSADCEKAALRRSVSTV